MWGSSFHGGRLCRFWQNQLDSVTKLFYMFVKQLKYEKVAFGILTGRYCDVFFFSRGDTVTFLAKVAWFCNILSLESNDNTTFQRWFQYITKIAKSCTRHYHTYSGLNPLSNILWRIFYQTARAATQARPWSVCDHLMPDDAVLLICNLSTTTIFRQMVHNLFLLILMQKRTKQDNVHIKLQWMFSWIFSVKIISTYGTYKARHRPLEKVAGFALGKIVWAGTLY